MVRQEGDNLPKIDYGNTQFQRSLKIAGGIDRMVGRVKKRNELGYGIEMQAAQLSKRIRKQMTREEAAEAQDAFHGSSRLLARDHFKKTGGYAGRYAGREHELLNATNVFDTAHDFASGRWPIPRHVQENLRRMRRNGSSTR